MPITNSQEEDIVKRWGFSHVSTNSFGPWAELPKHSHTDYNTHLIVSGSIIMIDYGVDNYHHKIQSTGLRPRDLYDVPAHVSYGGKAGPEGVVFVEGRKNLSAGLPFRQEGLETPNNLERPYVPVVWTGARAKVVEYESRGYFAGDSHKTADSSDSGWGLNSTSSRSSLTPIETVHDWQILVLGDLVIRDRATDTRNARSLISKGYGNDDSPVRSTWAWLWQRYWYGTR